jgi:hypothetical protein
VDSRLNTLGAVLLGIVTVALAWLWARQERAIVEALLQVLNYSNQALKECNSKHDDNIMMLLNAHERVHKAAAYITQLETTNRYQSEELNELRMSQDTLEEQLTIARTAAAGRQPSRRDDDRAETP